MRERLERGGGDWVWWRTRVGFKWWYRGNKREVCWKGSGGEPHWKQAEESVEYDIWHNVWKTCFSISKAIESLLLTKTGTTAPLQNTGDIAAVASLVVEEVTPAQLLLYYSANSSTTYNHYIYYFHWQIGEGGSGMRQARFQHPLPRPHLCLYLSHWKSSTCCR